MGPVPGGLCGLECWGQHPRATWQPPLDSRRAQKSKLRWIGQESISGTWGCRAEWRNIRPRGVVQEGGHLFQRTERGGRQVRGFKPREF